ncbi:MAG: hypothetical protein PHG69_04930 [Candidatus Omnitrophica bacterium]|nr:hypothetical protein [Candidatus Omnitrophota bacterium]
MSNIFFIEFAEDISCFLEHREADDIVVASRPEAALELDIRQIPYKCLQRDFYTHKEYMQMACECNSQLIPLLQYLDNELWKIDKQYRDLKLRPFQMFIYLLKFPLESLKSKIFEISKLFSDKNINKVKIIKHKTQPVKNDLCFYDNESLYEKLLYLFQKKNHKYEIEAIDNNQYRQEDNSLRRFNRKGIKKMIKPLLENLYWNISFGFRSLDKKRKQALSVGCEELQCIEQELFNLGWSIHGFPTRILNNKLVSPYKYSEIINEFEKNKALVGQFEFLGVNFFEVIKDKLDYFCKRLGTVLNNYKILDDFISKHHFDIIFFGNHASFDYQNVMLPSICKGYGIPYVCWMHGGYGANYQAQGYHASDFMFGQHYFTYGKNVKSLIDTHYSQYNLTTHVTGSPKILERYKDYVAPNNNKKVITLLVGPWGINCLHTETDSRYYRFSYWEPLKAIIEFLVGYSHKYRIIIRAGTANSSSQIEAFRRLLKYHNAEEIEIITIQEVPFESIVKITDLFINLWVSTTFWEESLTHADIFLFDDSDLTEEAKSIIPNRAFWHDNLPDFIKGLQQYLEKGIFYQKSQDRSFLANYMDFDRKDYLPKHVSQTMEDIVRK